LALLIGLSACRSMHSADADAAAAPSGCAAPARPNQFPDSEDGFLTTANLRLSPATMVGRYQLVLASLAGGKETLAIELADTSVCGARRAQIA
jgi:hypothetical protein